MIVNGASGTVASMPPVVVFWHSIFAWLQTYGDAQSSLI